MAPHGYLTKVAQPNLRVLTFFTLNGGDE